MEIFLKRMLKFGTYCGLALLAVFGYFYVNSRAAANFKLVGRLPGQAPYAYADAPPLGDGGEGGGGGGGGEGSGEGEGGGGEGGCGGEGGGDSDGGGGG
jgi:hypothetical protein